MCRLTNGNPVTWHGWVHGIAFLLIIATGVLAPLAMALAVRGDPGWRPIAVVSVAASAFKNPRIGRPLLGPCSWDERRRERFADSQDGLPAVGADPLSCV
jgi:hypothetical protein